MARQFNGSSDKITITGASVTNGTGTPFGISFWLNSAAHAFGGIYDESDIVNQGPLFFFMTNGSGDGHGDKVELELRSSPGGGSVDLFLGTKIIADSTWHNVVLSQNATSVMTLYVDGQVDQTFTRTALSNSGSQVFGNVLMGATANNGSFSNFYPGKLAHLATWSRELTSAEAVQLGSGLYPSLLNPKHYWPLDGTASPEPDQGSPGGVPGVLTGTSQAAGPTMHGFSTVDVLNVGLPVRGLR